MAASRVVTDDEGQEVFIISAKAQVVRINLEDVRVTNSRYTQGVIVWRDREADDYVASVACFTENDYSTGGSGASDDTAPSTASAEPVASDDSRDETEEKSGYAGGVDEESAADEAASDAE